MRLGFCGGGFGMPIARLAAAHPKVEGFGVAEADPARLSALLHAIPEAASFASFEDLIADATIDAVGIFTPPWLHSQHAIAALRAGKHVLCAVPIALTLDEISAVIAEVERTGLTYVTAETSAYYPDFLYCRERFRRGDFGEFVFGRGQNLYHPVMYDFYARDLYANLPPMLYATHTVSMVVGITGRRLTRVAAEGVHGLHPDLRGRRSLPQFEGDDVATESGLFLSDGGGTSHIVEARWVGHPGRGDNHFSVYGTDASFEELADYQVWRTAIPQQTIDLVGSFAHRTAGALARSIPGPLALVDSGPFAYLVDDFVRAIVDDRRPFNDAWQAARYAAPGIVAHESARRDGEWLEIPDFGENPVGEWTPDHLDEVLI